MDERNLKMKRQIKHAGQCQYRAGASDRDLGVGQRKGQAALLRPLLWDHSPSLGVMVARLSCLAASMFYLLRTRFSDATVGLWESTIFPSTDRGEVLLEQKKVGNGGWDLSQSACPNCGRSEGTWAKSSPGDPRDSEHKPPAHRASEGWRTPDSRRRNAVGESSHWPLPHLAALVEILAFRVLGN